jgi:hypothetical protein
MLKNLFMNFTVAIYFFFFYVFRNPITWIQNVKKICLRITVVGHYRQVFIYVFRDRLLAYKGSMAFFSQMNSRFDGHLAMLSNARDNIKKTLDLGEVKVSEWWVFRFRRGQSVWVVSVCNKRSNSICDMFNQN